MRVILDREQFLILLDLEVKRARRYQNFFTILVLNLVQVPRPEHEEKQGSRTLAHLIQDNLRESDILGSLGENRMVALLPYADSAAGVGARRRVESDLLYYDLKSEGHEVMVEQVCFPRDGANIDDLGKRILGAA